MPDASVVVVTYNALPWVEQCLESVRGEETIVVDNGSTDGTVDLVRERFPDGRVLEQENRGLGAGWNAGIEAATGRYFLLLNADAWLTEGVARAARRVRRRAPARGGRRAAAAEPGRNAAALGARLPDALAARDRVPLPAQARAALAAAERLLRRRVRPRRGARGGVRDGRVHARPPRGGRRGRAARRVASSSSARRPTGATASVGPAGRCSSSPAPSASTSAAAAHGGRMLRENLRGHLRFLAKHRGAGYAERARRLLLVGAARCAAGSSAASAAGCTGTRPAGSRSGAGPGAARAMTLLRLALATGVLLAPGALVARALGLRGAAATLAWSLALLFGALVLTFAAGASLTLRSCCCWRRVSRRCRSRAARRGPSGCPAAGGCSRAERCSGSLLWHVAGEIGGDGLFHLARVRKLEAFDSLSLDSVNEFADGGLHPGYAFPLWHGFLALVAKVAFLDPSVGRAARGVACSRRSPCSSRTRRGTRSSARSGLRSRSCCAQVGDHGARARARRRVHGARLPATAARQLLVPAALALALAYVHAPRRALARVGCGGRARARGRAPDLRALPLAAVRRLPRRALARRARRRRSRSPRRSRRSSCPPGVFFAWLLPVVRDTASVAPSGERDAARDRATTRGSSTSRRTRATGSRRRCFGRGGAVAVAALAAAAARRARAAAALGGVRARRLARRLRGDARAACSSCRSRSSSRSRSRAARPASCRSRSRSRAALAVLAGLLRVFVLPLALLAGIAFQLAYPGDFGYRLEHGGPALVTWIAVGRGRGRGRARRSCSGGGRPLERAGRRWSASPRGSSSSRSPCTRRGTGARRTRGARARSRPGSSRRCATRCPSAPSSTPTSRRATASRAFAPVYVAAAPPGHVADTEREPAVRAARRGEAVLRDRRPRDPAPARRRLARRRPRALPGRPGRQPAVRGRALRALPPALRRRPARGPRRVTTEVASGP